MPAPPPPKISKRKDHEKKKKEKKKKDETPAPASVLPVLPSITDVIKEGFIQRAKQDLQVEAQVKTKLDEGTPPPPSITETSTANGDEFDIPTISDIAKEAVEKQRHEKELQQLEELQKKIYIAKKQLQTMVSDESDDDFNVADTSKTTNVAPTPAVVAPARTGIYVNPKFFERNERIVPNSINNNNNSTGKVHDRLGTKRVSDDGVRTPEDPEGRRVVKLSAVRRAEREIYVPAFRRNAEMEKHRVDTNDRQIIRDRDRRTHAEVTNKREPLRSRIQIDRRIDIRRRSREDRKSPVRSRTMLDRSRLRLNSNKRSRSRSKSPIRRRRSPIRSRSRERRPFIKTRLEVTTAVTEMSDEQEVTRKRIGSRVFVMPPKPPSEEGDVDVPVNSVIKIKPRVHVPENKQASKMLLLRAVAEAQKSTFGSIPTKADVLKARQRRSVQDRLTIEVGNDEEDELDMTYDDIVIDEDEYVPAPVSKTSESESENYLYIPKKKAATRPLAVEESDEYDPDEITIKKDNTKFVVTLDTDEQVAIDARQKTPPPIKQLTKQKRSIKDRIGYRMKIDEDEEAKRRRKERFEQGYERVEEESKKRSPTPPPPPVIKRIFNRKPVKSRSNTPQDLRESKSPHHSNSPVFRNRSNDRKSDFWGESKRDETLVHHRHRSRARTISPINFDLTDEETRSRSSHEGHSEDEARKENRRDGEARPKIRKLEPTRKFDNVPSCEYLY